MFGIEKRKQKKEEERRRIEEERRKREEEERRKAAEKKANMKELGAYIMVIICDIMMIAAVPSFASILFAAVGVLLIPIKQIDNLWSKLLKGNSKWIKYLILGWLFVIACIIFPLSEEKGKTGNIEQTETNREAAATTTTEAKKVVATEKQTEKQTKTEAATEKETTTRKEVVTTTEKATTVKTTVYVEEKATKQNNNSSNSNNSINNQNATTAAQNNINNNSITVHITASGSKYHRAGCRYLRNSDSTVTLDKAKSLGLTPCSVCNPPQ